MLAHAERVVTASLNAEIVAVAVTAAARANAGERLGALEVGVTISLRLATRHGAFPAGRTRQ